MFTQRLIVTPHRGASDADSHLLRRVVFFIPVAFLMIVAGIEYANIMRALNHKLPLWILLPAIAFATGRRVATFSQPVRCFAFSEYLRRVNLLFGPLRTRNHAGRCPWIGLHW